jgi:hypothetical protein
MARAFDPRQPRERGLTAARARSAITAPDCCRRRTRCGRSTDPGRRRCGVQAHVGSEVNRADVLARDGRDAMEARLPMARLDWDRVRRMRPLDGADPRVDSDGAVLWEREVGEEREGDATSPPRSLDARFGIRRLRPGVVARRARERRDLGPCDGAAPPPVKPKVAAPFEASAWVECPRCRARGPRKKLLLHARAACAKYPTFSS